MKIVGFFFFSSRRRHTRYWRDWSSDVCSSDLEVPTYDFPVRDHIEIGEALGAIDMERGAKASGARFYFLTGPGALLEFALAPMAISRAVAAGFTPDVAPALVRPEAMEGTGFLGDHDR